MTNIAVFQQPFQTEDRSWLLSDFDDIYAEGGTLSVAAFTAATHYPNGYLPSGTLVGVITASGLLGPYDGTATDGRQTCTGLTVDSVTFFNYTPVNGLLTSIGVAVTRFNAVVSQARLPFNATNAATGRGYVDAAAITALRNVLFLA